MRCFRQKKVETHKPRRRYHKVFAQILVCFAFVAVAVCCISSNKQLEDEQALRQELANKLYGNKNEDSLKLLLSEFQEEENDLGKMLCYKQLGLYLRENARFSEAIHNHQEGLAIALKLKDTVEIVQALNNLGTDFRRIGAQGEASEYHFKALSYAEDYSQANIPGPGMKNRVVALNGIGNVSLTLGYLEDAEKYFRMALKDEIELQSQIGQAINYANLGAIFEGRRQIDSAFVYYNRSLEHNKIAKSNMGIGLCLIHIGALHEKEGQYTQAKEQYLQAYQLMDKIADKWHWLEACLSLARIHLAENNHTEFDHYIHLAENTANTISSPEHLGKVYQLKHDRDVRQGDYQSALQNYMLQTQMQDSVQGIQKSNRYLDIRVGYEQNRSTRLIEQMEIQNKLAEQKKGYAILITWLVLAVSVLIMALFYYAYRQRTRSNKILREMERTRSDFFTNITHEFRTPLTVIQGFNRKIREDKNLPEKEKEMITDAIERQSNRLLSLVNQLLDIAKIRAGKDTPEWKYGDIVSYLRMSAEGFELYAKSKNRKIVFYSGLSTQNMDFIPFYIDRIISNLLSNAIKHTQEGGEIKLSVWKSGNEQKLNIRVADNGTGIAPEELPHIFELFYQSPYAKNDAGSGIGLAFTRMMVEKMGGTIRVESTLNKGATFTITLPIGHQYQEQTEKHITPQSFLPDIHYEILAGETETLPSDLPQTAQPVILVVEDNRDVAWYIKTVIGNSYNVLMAKNGQEGWEMAQEYVPDLVITDLMMPVKDGNRLCCEIRESLLLNHIPVIMLTAKSSDEDRIEGLRCGADAYIRKPFQPEELQVRIEKLLENRRLMKDKFKNEIQAGTQRNHVIDTENDTFILKLNDLIHRNMQSEGLTPSFIAEHFSMSLSQLNRKLNAISGYASSAYITQVKLAHACKLLSTTSQTVTDVANACGFYDLSYFSRTFKKYIGLSPLQFQRSLPRSPERPCNRSLGVEL